MIVSSAGMIASTIASVIATIGGIAGSIEKLDGITATFMIADSVTIDDVLIDAGDSDCQRKTRVGKSEPVEGSFLLLPNHELGSAGFVITFGFCKFAIWTFNSTKATTWPYESVVRHSKPFTGTAWVSYVRL